MGSESPETWQQIAAIVGGAGLTGTVQGLVKSFLPQVSAEIGGAVAGGLMIYFGDRVHWVVKALGVGILAGSLAPMIAGAIPKIGVGAPPAAAPPAATAASKAAATYAAAKRAVPTVRGFMR